MLENSELNRWYTVARLNAANSTAFREAEDRAYVNACLHRINQVDHPMTSGVDGLSSR